MKEKKNSNRWDGKIMLVIGMLLGGLFISNWDAFVIQDNFDQADYRSITPVVAADQR